MNTLTKQFPLVKQIKSTPSDDPAKLAQPYVMWELIAFDDVFNILLSKYVKDFSRASLNDLVILIGPVATTWMDTLKARTQVRV